MPDWWVDYEGAPFAAAGALLSTLFALRLDKRPRRDSAVWTFPAALDTNDFGRILDAESAVHRAHDIQISQSRCVAAISAWCTGVHGTRSHNTELMRDAARQYEPLTKRLAVLDEDEEPLSVPFSRGCSAWSSAMLYRAASELDKARDLRPALDRDRADVVGCLEVQGRNGAEDWLGSRLGTVL